MTIIVRITSGELGSLDGSQMRPTSDGSNGAIQQSSQIVALNQILYQLLINVIAIELANGRTLNAAVTLL